MTRLTASIALFGSATLAACGSSDKTPGNGEFDVGVLPDTNSADGTRADTTTGGDTAGTDGGDAADVGDAPTDTFIPFDTAPHDGGTDTWVSDVDALAPPVCPTDFPFGVTPVAVTYPHSAGGDLLAAITWDERTMVWTTNAGGTVTVNYGDRAGRDDAFTTVHTLATSLGPFGEDKVALSADGLTMMFPSVDHKKLTQVSRASRSAEFDAATATTLPFNRISGGGEGTTPRLASDLVLSKDGRTLFFTDLTPTSGVSIFFSDNLGDGTWGSPAGADASHLLIATGGARRRPSGLSSDGRTLFYFDEYVRGPKSAFRKLGAPDFTEFYDVNPIGVRVMPTDACDRLYLSIETTLGDGGDGPLAIYHAP